MTLDELKEEARKQGYNLIKRDTDTKLLPCTCGHNRRTWFFSSRGIYLVCKACGKSSQPGVNAHYARHNWNAMIKIEEGEDNV